MFRSELMTRKIRIVVVCVCVTKSFVAWFCFCPFFVSTMYTSDRKNKQQQREISNRWARNDHHESFFLFWRKLSSDFELVFEYSRIESDVVVNEVEIGGSSFCTIEEDSRCERGGEIHYLLLIWTFDDITNEWTGWDRSFGTRLVINKKFHTITGWWCSSCHCVNIRYKKNKCMMEPWDCTAFPTWLCSTNSSTIIFN